MNASNSHLAIDTLAWLIEQAFDGDPSHSRPREELLAWLTEGHRRWLPSAPWGRWRARARTSHELGRQASYPRYYPDHDRP